MPESLSHLSNSLRKDSKSDPSKVGNGIAGSFAEKVSLVCVSLRDARKASILLLKPEMGAKGLETVPGVEEGPRYLNSNSLIRPSNSKRVEAGKEEEEVPAIPVSGSVGLGVVVGVVVWTSTSSTSGIPRSPLGDAMGLLC